MDNDLWFEKYRPRRLDEYVWRDDALKTKAEQWLQDGALPHLLLAGKPGTGKTSLARLLLDLLGVTRADILYIPCSRDSKKDDILERVGMFTTTCALNPTGIKYVILDEADSITKNAQKSLRADMEIYQGTSRFILTCNDAHDIIEPLRSRLDEYHFTGLDQNEFQMRLVEVMRSEQIDVSEIDNIQAMLTIADRHYPDLRRSIGMLQKWCVVGEKGVRRLIAQEGDEESRPYLFTVTDHIAAGRLREARTLLAESAPIDDYPDIFRWAYRNLQLWGPTEDQQDAALLAIRDALYKHALVAVPEINMAAMLTELCSISKKAK